MGSVPRLALTAGGAPDSPFDRLVALLRAMPGDAAGIKAATGPATDWPALIERARWHGVLPAVVAALDAAGTPVPAVYRGDLERQAAVAALWHAHLRATEDFILRLLAEAGLRAAPLKGPLLAERLYAHGGMRSSVDLDLLVDESALDRAAGALETAGWRTSSGPTARYARRHHHHLTFTRPNHPPVELHFRARTGFGTVVPSTALLDRATQMTTPGGAPAFRLAVPDELVYLAVHAASHGYVKLMWLYDLKLFVLMHPDLDWPEAARRAGAIRALSAVRFTCALLGDVLAVPVPHLDLLRPSGLRARAARRVLPLVAAPREASTADRASSLVFGALLADRARSAAWLVQHHALRGLKRRVQRRLPAIAPEDWAG